MSVCSLCTYYKLIHKTYTGEDYHSDYDEDDSLSASDWAFRIRRPVAWTGERTLISRAISTSGSLYLDRTFSPSCNLFSMYLAFSLCFEWWMLCNLSNALWRRRWSLLVAGPTVTNFLPAQHDLVTEWASFRPTLSLRLSHQNDKPSCSLRPKRHSIHIN